MSGVHETAYPRLKLEFTERELIAIYSPTLAELEFVASQYRHVSQQAFLLIQLKLLQRLRYFVALSSVLVRISYIQDTTRREAKLSPLRPVSPLAETSQLDNTGHNFTNATESSMSTQPAPTLKPANTEKVLEAKWGKTLIAAGFTALPDVIFHNQKALKLKPLDILILLHLASYWWKPNANPWPAKSKIADAIDVDPSTVQRSIKKMEDLGYITRIYRKAGVGDNLSNEYDLRGLVKAAKKHADEKLALKAKRAAEDKTKQTTPTAFSLIDGGKKK